MAHGLETCEGDLELVENEVEIAGAKYSTCVGNRVSLAISCTFTGPQRSVMTYSSVLQALVSQTEFGDRVVVEPWVKFIGG